MKLEKREISLNEIDSVTDALCAQKSLLLEYCICLEKIARKEIRVALLERIGQIGKDIFLLCDLKRSIQKDNA